MHIHTASVNSQAKGLPSDRRQCPMLIALSEHSLHSLWASLASDASGASRSNCCRPLKCTRDGISVRHFTSENQPKLLLPAFVLETAPTTVRVLSSKALVAVAILRAVLYSHLQIDPVSICMKSHQFLALSVAITCISPLKGPCLS